MSDADDRKEDLRAALDTLREPAEVPATEPAEAPAEEAKAPDAAPAEEAAPAEKPGRVRDESGRFAPKEKDAPAPDAKPAPEAKAAPQQAPTAPVEQKATLQPPRSWKPAAREKWASLAPELQQDIVRREHEVAVTLQQTAEARRSHEAYQQALAPIEHIMRADGFSGPQVVADLARTVAQLRLGTPAQKAGLVANIVRQYGVGIEDLAAALDGGPQPQRGQQQAIDPQAIVRQAEQAVLSRIQAQQTQQTRAQAATELQKFAAEHEFFEDVRDVMGRLMEGGLAMSLADAYATACKMTPDVSRVIDQRNAAKAATNARASTQRARAAGSSVRTTPASSRPEQDAGGDDRKADLRRALAAQRG